MDQRQLQAANGDLGQKPKSPMKMVILIILGILLGIIVLAVLVGLVVFAFLFISHSSTYPFIPTPKNTLRSRSIPEFLTFLIMDAAESQEEYGVISRRVIQGW